jgi:hypothetical protein
MAVNFDLLEGFSFLGFGLLWLGFLIFWFINNYYINKRHLKPLHKFMNFIVACKCIECFCLVGYILNQSGAEYWGIAVTSMITIYKTFIYTSLVLASKGFCVISDILQRRELSIVALVMGSVYLIYSAYFIEADLVIIVLLCMVVSLFYITSKYTLENIRLLKTRQLALMESGIQNLLAPIQAKIDLLVWFLRLSCYYYLTQFLVLFIVIIIAATGNMDREASVTLTYFDETFELTAIGGILFLLRPKSNVPYFDINLIEPNRPNRPLAPVYKAGLPEGFEAAVVSNRPFLLIAPKGLDVNAPFKNLLIANPVPIK